MHSRRQPQRIPPPIDHGPERIDAEPLLRELPGDLGLVLWKSVRSVRLWTELPEGERGSAFSPDAYESRVAAVAAAVQDPELRAMLEDVARPLREPGMLPAEVAEPLTRLSSWARDRLPLSALELAQAAAFADPRSPIRALVVGNRAQDAAQLARAESWTRRAVTVARQARDWGVFSRAFSSLSMIAMRRGNIPLSRKYAIRAVRAAKRHSLREELRRGYSDLLLLATGAATGVVRLGEVHRYLKLILELTPPGHFALTIVANQVATAWSMAGYFRPALDLFMRVPLPDMPGLGPSVQAGVKSNLATAAAGAGEMEIYRTTMEEVLELVENPAVQEGLAQVYMALAHAAVLAGDLDLAEQLTDRLAAIATARGESYPALMVDKLRGTIHADRRAATVTRPSPRPVPNRVRKIADEITAALTAD